MPAMPAKLHILFILGPNTPDISESTNQTEWLNFIDRTLRASCATLTASRDSILFTFVSHNTMPSTLPLLPTAITAIPAISAGHSRQLVAALCLHWRPHPITITFSIMRFRVFSQKYCTRSKMHLWVWNTLYCRWLECHPSAHCALWHALVIVILPIHYSHSRSVGRSHSHMRVRAIHSQSQSHIHSQWASELKRRRTQSAHSHC